MPHLPDFETFQRLAAGHQLVPVYRRMLSDALTPVTAFALLDGTATPLEGVPPQACLFESVVGGEKVGRYSFLGVEPFWELIAHGTRVTVRGEGGTRQFEAADPLDELRKRLIEFKAVHLPDLPPFEGGAIGYAGYDVVRYVEKLPNAPRDDRGLPDLSFAFYDRMVVFDNVSKTMFLIAMARLDRTGGDARVAYDDACRRVDDLATRLSQPVNLPPADVATTGVPKIAWKSNFEQPAFEAAVRKCVEYIKAGDIFQVVL